MVRYRDAEGLYVGTREAAFCALRAQLLMALHDAGATELCSQVLVIGNNVIVLGVCIVLRVLRSRSCSITGLRDQSYLHHLQEHPAISVGIGALAHVCKWRRSRSTSWRGRWTHA